MRAMHTCTRSINAVTHNHIHARTHTGTRHALKLNFTGKNSLRHTNSLPRPHTRMHTHRYADDVHYIGGAVLGEQMLSWGSIMFAWNARPPDPAHEPVDWRAKWVRPPRRWHRPQRMSRKLI